MKIPPAQTGGQVDNPVTKIAGAFTYIKFLANGRAISLRGLQAQVLTHLLAIGNDGLPCGGEYRAVVANLPQVIAALRKYIDIATIRGVDRQGRYVLKARITVLDVRSL